MAKVFVSYSRVDVAVAKLLKTGLEARGHRVVLDIDDLGRGDWSAQLERGIRHADDVLVLVSAAALVSPNVGREVAFALDAGKALVPVLLAAPPEEEPPGWAQQLLRNQAARYDPLDLEVSLTRIERLLTRRERRRWPWLVAAAAGMAALALVVLMPTRQPELPAPAPAGAAASASMIGVQLQIHFRGAIRREQMQALEARFKSQGLVLPERSQRDETVSDTAVRFADAPLSHAAADVLRASVAYFAELGCRLTQPVDQPLRVPAEQVAVGVLRLSVYGTCP
jgi:hypothetical protein